MKLFFAFLFLASTAFASFNEVECESALSSVKISLEIELPFPREASFRNTTVSVDDETYFYTVTPRTSNGFNHLRYWGGGLSLDVNLWPDTRPTWGRTYQATLSSSDVLEGRNVPVSCRFPNAF